MMCDWCRRDSGFARVARALRCAFAHRGMTSRSRIDVHEIAQQRIDFVVPALAAEYAVMADAGLHVVHLAIAAHAGAETLRRSRLSRRTAVALMLSYLL